VPENSTVDTLPEFAGLGRVEQSFAEGVCDGVEGQFWSLVGSKSIQNRALYGRDWQPFMDVDLLLGDVRSMDSNPPWPLPAQPGRHRNGKVYSRRVHV
jgi:hypothetical protein